ncbi:MAG TPA: hypothetical protein VF727_11170 [Allosphingosinicella sp.]
MRIAGPLAYVSLLLLGCEAPGEKQAVPFRAAAVVAASKAATGGSAWDRLDGCYEEGTHADGAIPYKTWFSFRRYGMRVESRRGDATRAMGFNGKASWQAAGEGAAQVGSEPEALQEAIVTAYLTNNGFYFPDRFPARFRHAREAVEGGRIFDVVEIAPEGGRPLQFWFDRSTRLIDRVVDTRGTPPVTVKAGDYRRVGGVTVAFALTVVAPDGKEIDRGRVTSLRCGSVDEALFDPPR